MEVVDVDKLYKLLYEAFLEELANLSVGHGFDLQNLDYMDELIHSIMFLEDPVTKSNEGISILNRYSSFK